MDIFLTSDDVHFGKTGTGRIGDAGGLKEVRMTMVEKSISGSGFRI